MASSAQQLTDAELARETRAGSIAAYEELLQRYEKRVFGFVAQSCRDRMDAEEITQDVFVKAYQAIARYDPRHGFDVWLFAIARRKCIDRFRARRARLDPPEPEAVAGDDPAAELERRETATSLWNVARACLPDIQFQALWLRYAEDMDVRQIAQVLRRTRTHVKVLLFRARRRLAEQVSTEAMGRLEQPNESTPSAGGVISPPSVSAENRTAPPLTPVSRRTMAVC